MENQPYKKLLKFYGDHGKITGILIINQILTVLTLGIYYPWARASYMQYVYNETEYIDTRFVFHGTGKEMFIGFLKAIGVLIVMYGILFGCFFSGVGIIMLLGILLFFTAILLLAPIAIHGSLRYRLSRTSWRGIHFGYRGNLKEFIKLYLTHGLLTVITFGIYSSWFTVEVRKYVFNTCVLETFNLILKAQV
jgi:uncharacterized membrane protein YjgN (DUF898 family)